MKVIAKVEDTKYKDKDVKDDIEYYYKITAVNERGESESTDIQSIRLVDTDIVSIEISILFLILIILGMAIIVLKNRR